MGEAAEAQYEADLARAMELSLRTHAAEAAWRRDSGQVQLPAPAPAPGGCLHVSCLRVALSCGQMSNVTIVDRVNMQSVHNCHQDRIGRSKNPK